MISWHSSTFIWWCLFRGLSYIIVHYGGIIDCFNLSTKNSLYTKKGPITRRPRAAALLGQPQAAGSVYRLRIVTPKKPNSARRPTVKAYLNNGKHAVSHIPGQGHNLKRHSKILIRGGGARDLPGVRHTCIRAKLDFLCSKNKTKRRSIYGVKRPQDDITKIRRCLRRSN